MLRKVRFSGWEDGGGMESVTTISLKSASRRRLGASPERTACVAAA